AWPTSSVNTSLWIQGVAEWVPGVSRWSQRGRSSAWQRALPPPVPPSTHSHRTPRSRAAPAGTQTTRPRPSSSLRRHRARRSRAGSTRIRTRPVRRPRPRSNSQTAPTPSMCAPPIPPATSIPPPPSFRVVPPTTILSGPPNPPNNPAPPFSFSSSAPGSSFECMVDADAFASCVSPKTTPRLADGSHAFYVRAIDKAGYVDATPASRTFTVQAAPSGLVIETDDQTAESMRVMQNVKSLIGAQGTTLTNRVLN